MATPSTASPRSYFDHCATTPMYPQARQAWLEACDAVNPGGQYLSGRRARGRLDDAREAIARILGVDPIEVVFTSGGTESDNIAVRGLYWAAHLAGRSTSTVYTTPIEHPAVLTTVQDLEKNYSATVDVMDVDSTGRVTPDALARLAAHPGAVATMMWANNETGVIQPVEAFCRAAENSGTPAHIDATQALGKIPVSLAGLPVATMAAAAHKFGGPRSCGLLVARRAHTPSAVYTGGGQERGIRPGTLDVASAVATAVALECAIAELDEVTRRLRGFAAEIVATIKTIDGAIIHSDPASESFLPGVVSASFPGAEGDSLIMLADRAGIECSTGSACHSGVNRASHVLVALGIDEYTARGTMRLSMGRTTTRDDVDRLLAELPAIVATARAAGMA